MASRKRIGYVGVGLTIAVLVIGSRSPDVAELLKVVGTASLGISLDPAITAALNVAPLLDAGGWAGRIAPYLYGLLSGVGLAAVLERARAGARVLRS